MIKGFSQRLRAAWQIVRKGSSFPFNQVGPVDGLGGLRLTEAYRNSPWVQRAIKKVAGPIAAVSLQFRTVGGSDLVDDPGLQAFWQAPAAGMTRADFIEASVGWLKLAGEFFWLRDDRALSYGNAPFPEMLSGKQKLQQLIVARPDRMTEVVSGGELIGWRFRDGRGENFNLLPEQVLHCKSWNPYNEWRGLGEMEAAMQAAEADWLAGKFNLNLMRNNGDQGPYIVAKSGIPDDKQRAQIVEALREKKELSLRGMFKPMFLTGDITVEDPKVQAVDAAMLAGRLQNRHEIFLAFGVPPSMADKMESYSVGSASDWYILLFETCVPTAGKLAACIGEMVRQQTAQEFEVGFNWREHPVMQQVIGERVDTAVKLWDKGMPMEKVNDYLDLGLPEFEGWEVGYLPFGVAPVGSAELLEPTPEPLTSEDFGEEGAEDAEEKEEEEEGKSRTQNIEHRTSNAERKKRATEKEKWRWYMSRRLGTVKAFQSKFNRELMVARAEVLRKLHGLQKLQGARGNSPLQGNSPVQRAAAVDFMFDLNAFARGLKAAFRKEAARALQTAGEQLFAEIAKDDVWKVAPSEVKDFFTRRENRLVDVAQEVFESVKGQLEEGIDAGESIAELSGRVRGQFNDMSRERSKRIAMTETSAAYGTGRQMAMKDAGVTEKRWLTSGNANVRPAHRAANGQVVLIDEDFEVGGESLKHPGDPYGSPGNVINCHCVAVPVA